MSDTHVNQPAAISAHPSYAAPKCINCVHFVPAPKGERFNRCQHPGHGLDLVTAEPVKRPCELVRHNSRQCGEPGQWFEPSTASAETSRPDRPAGLRVHFGAARLELINWLFAGLIAFVLSCAWLLDGPSEVQAMQATAATVSDAQQQARQTARFDRAARRLCEGGEYLLIGRAEIACTEGAGGRKVLSVKVAL